MLLLLIVILCLSLLNSFLLLVVFKNKNEVREEIETEEVVNEEPYYPEKNKRLKWI